VQLALLGPLAARTFSAVQLSLSQSERVPGEDVVLKFEN
jgi:hypothetical protein